MKRYILLFLVLFVAPAYAIRINAQGTAGAPVSVGGSPVTVIKGSPHRHWYCIFAETQAIRCEAGDSANAAPTTTPSTTVGYYIPPQTNACFNGGTQAQFQADISPEMRLDCVATTGSTNVDTIEP